MKYSEDVFYTRDHEWVSGKSGTVRIGISSYAVEQLGDIVHVDLPEKDSTLSGGDSLGTVESTKTVSDIYVPATGKVIEINSALESEPEKIMEDPYGSGWLVSIELSDSITDGLMNSKEYQKYIEESES